MAPQAHHVGTMIELPRAAVTAADIAGSADFFSFGRVDEDGLGRGETGDRDAER